MNAEPPAFSALILVVDDDPGTVRLIEKTLQRENYRTAAAYSAAEASNWLDSHSPDLMLLDLRLSDAGGAELVQSLHARERAVPFIVITGQGDERAAVQMMKLGALDYLVKDLKLQAVVPAVVRRALEQLERDRRLAAAEEALRARERQQAAVAELGRRALSGIDLEMLFEEALSVLAKTAQVEFSKIQELSEDGRSLLLTAGVGWEPGAVKSEVVSAGRETPAGLALHVNGPVIIRDLQADPRFVPPPLLVKHGAISGMTVLIHTRPKPFGVLGIHSSRIRDFNEDDINFLQAVANVLAEAIQRKRAEESLREEHAFISAVLNTSSALVVVIDREGRIFRFNRACEQLTGRTFEEVKGRRLWDLFVPPEDLPAVQGVLERLEAGESPLQHENFWLAGDGSRRLIAWSNSVLADAEGRPEYFIGTGIEITERKQLEREILEISDREKQRIGQDLHDGLCQHLAGIELMSQALEQRAAVRSKALAATAGDIAHHVRDAIAHTRSLSRGLSPVHLEADGLMSALRELAGNLEGMFGIKCLFRGDAPVLIEDNAAATHLFRIAQEAASNAIKHGRATQVEIILESDREKVMLIVRDNGTGIPDEAERGRGMGLRIMQYRAGMIGGRLTVQRNVPRGTLVICLMPRSRAALGEKR